MSDATIPMAADVTPVQVQVKEPFDALYHREFDRMVRLATALVDRTEEAEEVVQEAFAQVYLRYRVVENPVGYLRVSVLNGCRKVLRRRAVARRWRPDPGDTAGLGFDHVLDAVRRLPDRMLSDAFSGVRAGGSRPSLGDVHRRARRHLHRRRAGLAVGAVALVGAGGAALAARDGSSGTTAPAGAGDLDGPQATATTFPATTTTCVVYEVTTLPEQAFGSYVVQEGDVPFRVAQKFDLTVEELDAANASTPGYDVFEVGAVITIPTAGSPMGMDCTPGGGPDVATGYRCLGEGRTGDDGYTYYDWCEQVWPWADVTTTMVEYPTSTIPDSSNGNPGTTTTGPVPGSSNGNSDTTTTTGPVPSSTTPGAP